MIVPLLSLLWAASANSPGTLAGCLEQKDRACVAAVLKEAGDANSADYWAVAGRAYMFLGQPQEALKAIRQALQQQPENYEYLMEQGWICQKAGDQVSAIHSFLLAARAKPQSAPTFYELGMSFFLLDEYQRAAPHFRHVLQLEPANDKAEFMLGILEIMTNHEPDATPHFERALRLQPKNSHYLLHYGVLLDKFGDTQKGIDFMLQAEVLDASNPLTHYNLGRAYLELGKLKDAREELETSIRLRPSLTPAYYKLAAVYKGLGDSTKAHAAAQRYAQLQQADKKEQEDDPGSTLLRQ